MMLFFAKRDDYTSCHDCALGGYQRPTFVLDPQFRRQKPGPDDEKCLKIASEDQEETPSFLGVPLGNHQLRTLHAGVDQSFLFL